MQRRDFLALTAAGGGVVFASGLAGCASTVAAQGPGDFHFVHYGALAMGGAAMLITEMTCVAPDARITRGCTGLWTGSTLRTGLCSCCTSCRA